MYTSRRQIEDIRDTVYPLTSQEILKYFSDGFLKNPMCQVTLLNLSTGICSNPRLIALYYRNRVGVGEGLGRVILNTKEGARERPKGCWALVPAAAHRPIQVAKRCGTYAATLLSRFICTYRESIIMTSPDRSCSGWLSTSPSCHDSSIPRHFVYKVRKK